MLGNGRTDLLTLNADTRTVGLLAGLGQSRFANPTTFLYSNKPQVLVTADFSHDGRDDVAILGTGIVSIYRSLGNGQFAAPFNLDVGPDATGLSVADVNHDGNPDLLVGNRYGDVLVLYGNGNETFQPYRRADSTMALAVADLNGDGIPDYVFGDQGLDRVAVQLGGSGSTGFTQGRGDGLLAPGAVKLADLNGDGIPDLVVANSGGNNVLVYLGLGGGRFGPATSYFVGTNPAGLTIADVNADGIPDVVVANRGSNDVSILLGQGKGASWTLTPGPRLNSGGSGPVSITVADVTGPLGKPDGVPDLLVSNSQSNNVALIPGVGNGFFNDVAPKLFNTGADPVQTLVGNFNGQNDFVSINAGSNSLTFFSGFSQNGVTISSGGDHPMSAVEGDFNHDGLMDLAVANNGDGRVALLLGDANGLSLASTFGVDGMSHPTALTLGLDGRTAYIAGESGEWATSVDLSLHLPRAGVDSEGQFALRVGTTLPTLDAVERQREAGLVPLRETSLALVATILTGVEAVLENTAASGGEDVPPREEPPDGPPMYYWWKTKPHVTPEVADLLFGLDSAAQKAGASLSEGGFRAATETVEPPLPPPMVPERAGEETKPDAAPARPDETTPESVGAALEPEAPRSRWPGMGIIVLLAQAAAFVGATYGRKTATAAELATDEHR